MNGERRSLRKEFVRVSGIVMIAAGLLALIGKASVLLGIQSKSLPDRVAVVEAHTMGLEAWAVKDSLSHRMYDSVIPRVGRLEVKVDSLASGLDAATRERSALLYMTCVQFAEDHVAAAIPLICAENKHR